MKHHMTWTNKVVSTQKALEKWEEHPVTLYFDDASRMIVRFIPTGWIRKKDSTRGWESATSSNGRTFYYKAMPEAEDLHDHFDQTMKPSGIRDQKVTCKTSFRYEPPSVSKFYYYNESTGKSQYGIPVIHNGEIDTSIITK